MEQLKEKIKQINDANAQIASNTGGQTMVMQPNGSTASSSQSNMNELHEGFYKLGQNVSSMEQTIDNLSKSIQEANAGTPYYYGAPQNPQYPAQPQISYYPYGYPQNYPQYNPNSPYANQQMPQSGQTSNQMGSTNSNMQMDPNMQMNPNSQMNSNTPMNHSSLNLSGFLNANNIKLVLSLILLGSIILGIVAVVGFVSSLFKPKKVTQDNVQI